MLVLSTWHGANSLKYWVHQYYMSICFCLSLITLYEKSCQQIIRASLLGQVGLIANVKLHFGIVSHCLHLGCRILKYMFLLFWLHFRYCF